MPLITIESNSHSWHSHDRSYKPQAAQCKKDMELQLQMMKKRKRKTTDKDWKARRMSDKRDKRTAEGILKGCSYCHCVQWLPSVKWMGLCSVYVSHISLLILKISLRIIFCIIEYVTNKKILILRDFTTHPNRTKSSQYYCLIIPVPGGVGLRAPVATSRLELPPDLLEHR